jgi:uncharacterized protein
MGLKTARLTGHADANSLSPKNDEARTSVTPSSAAASAVAGFGHSYRFTIMNKTPSIIRLFAAFSLCSAIVACGGSPSAMSSSAVRADAQAKSPFVGYWAGPIKYAAYSLSIGFKVFKDGDDRFTAVMDPLKNKGKNQGGTVKIDKDSISISVAALKGSFRGKLSADGNTITGNYSMKGTDYPLALSKRQEPVPPFPYAATEVRIPSEGILLSGTLVRPEGKGPFKAVVFVHGSGPCNRDEQYGSHRLFFVIADALAREGVASLRYDKRGVGRSQGDPDVHRSTTEDLADDATVVARWLRANAGFPISSIGIIGHSEGGLIAPIVASRGAADFIVLMGTSAVPGRECCVAQLLAVEKASGESKPALDAIETTAREITAMIADGSDRGAIEARIKNGVKAAGIEDSRLVDGVKEFLDTYATPWGSYFLKYDPRPTLCGLSVPALALYGGLDLKVPPGVHASAMRDALKVAGNPGSQVVDFPMLNHEFQTAATGLPSEFTDISETIAPIALKKIEEWIGSL